MAAGRPLCGGAQRASRTAQTSIWPQQLEEPMGFQAGNYAGQTRPHDYFITFISLGLSSFRRKWLRCDNSPTKQSIFTICSILQRGDFYISEAFPDWIFHLLCHIHGWTEAVRSGEIVVSIQTTWISALLSFFHPLTHFSHCCVAGVQDGLYEQPGKLSGYSWLENGPAVCGRNRWNEERGKALQPLRAWLRRNGFMLLQRNDERFSTVRYPFMLLQCQNRSNNICKIHPNINQVRWVWS